jgi:two-component system, LytTR family, response regulator
MLKVVIIDDEYNAVQLISSILTNNFPEVQILGKTQSPLEGIKLINTHKPNLVFLDIEMPEANGFDILEALPDRNFETIFITAYDKYAIKAFKYSAIDYILKPIDIDEFNAAVNKVISKLSDDNTDAGKIELLMENLKAQQPYKISISSNKGYEYINIQDIIRIEADGRYCSIFLDSGRNISVTKLLSELIDTIDNKTFFRPHKSHYINLNKVKMFVKADGGYIKMVDGSQVAIARNKREEFLCLMDSSKAKE